MSPQLNNPQVNKARLDTLGVGRFRVSGVLDASTVGDILKQSHERFASTSNIEVDLGGVSEGDSAGLALLIEWLRLARNASQQIHFTNIPAQIQALARISEVEDLLFANESASRHGHDSLAAATVSHTA